MRTALLFVAIIAMAQAQSTRQIIGPDATRPFSGAVKAGGIVYVAGTIGPAAGGTLAKDIKGQTKQTLDNIAATLKSAGSSMANAAAVMVYLRNASDFAGMNEVYSTYWPKDPPTRTTVVVTQPLALADGLIEISMVAVANGGQRMVVHPKDWIKSLNPYSYGIKTGDTLFLSGLISRNGKDNTTVKGDITAQTKTILDNGKAILAEAGMTYGDVVSARVFITDDSTFQAFNAAYRPYFTASSMPARATVKAGLTGADYAVEITMVAVKDPSRKAITTPNADGTPGTANANLSSAIQAGSRLYLSGTLGNTAGNKGDAKAQTAESMTRIARTLKAAGYDWSNITDAVVYLPDMTKYQDMNASYRAAIMKDFPARATVGTGLMGADAMVEIMMTAAK